jgi:hypothetical protein
LLQTTRTCSGKIHAPGMLNLLLCDAMSTTVHVIVHTYGMYYVSTNYQAIDTTQQYLSIREYHSNENAVNTGAL